MNEPPHLPNEPLDGISKRKQLQGIVDPWESTVSSQIGSQENDLAKNQWIPFASTAVILLLMVALVSFVGSLAVRRDPSLTPTLVPTAYVTPTMVISPTPTSMPSPTAETPTRVPITLRVLPITANVRAAPSTGARIIGQIKKDSLATPLARSDDGRWFLVVNFESGITGWVANELFETISGDPKILPTVVPLPTKSTE